MYHSKKCRYVQLYVDSDKADQVMEDLKKERYVKKVLPCHLKDLDTDFVGVYNDWRPHLWSQKFRKRNHLMDCAFY